jgi:hypothetical protein
VSAVGYAVKTMHVKIGAVDYRCAVTGVTESPTADTVTTRTACPDGVKQDTGPAAWTLTVDYNVSNLPDSFHRLLRDSEGDAATISVEPFPLEEPGTLIEYDVTLTPGGGAFVVGQFGTASVVLPVTGSPRTTDPA